MTRFEGTCNVCGKPISLEHDPHRDGMIDLLLENGRLVTWVRHYATTPEGANPDCAIYSSRVYEVPA